MFKMQGRVFCEAPNNAIYKFEGQMIFEGETEIMQNSMAATYKFSGLEIYTNYAIAVVLLT